MHSFAQLTGLSDLETEGKWFCCVDYPTMKFSPLLFSVILIVASSVGLLASVLIHWIVGISLAATLIFIPLIFVFLLRYLLRHKDYVWTATVAHFIKKRLDILRFLLQVVFMNPYAYLHAKTTDCRKMKSARACSSVSNSWSIVIGFRFIFTEYDRVSVVEGEKACEGMIAELATNVEESFGLVATRLCRALHSKSLYRSWVIILRCSSVLLRFESSSISTFLRHSGVHYCRRPDRSGAISRPSRLDQRFDHRDLRTESILLSASRCSIQSFIDQSGLHSADQCLGPIVDIEFRHVASTVDRTAQVAEIEDCSIRRTFSTTEWEFTLSIEKRSQSIVLHHQSRRSLSEYQHSTGCSHRWFGCLWTTTNHSNPWCKSSIHENTVSQPFLFF